jgi:hypothetical protein
MVERVAAAILAKLPSALQYGSAGIATRILVKGLARAAIEAMQEPTKAMTSAACQAPDVCTIEGGEITHSHREWPWPHMIDASAPKAPPQ